MFYVGANIDPVDHVKKLPVGLVNADEGAAVGGKQVNLGAQITESIEKSTASGDKIDWKVMDEKAVKEEFDEGKLYGALVVPADFTSATTALTDATTTGTPARPTLTVLTNQSAGSMGSSLARTATTQAAENASLQVGKELTAQTGTGQTKLPAAARILLADPASVTIQDRHPLDSHSGLGLTAFYYALTLVVGFSRDAGVIMTTNRPVALVTGASSGIGKETALALVAAGFDVAGTGRDTSRVTPLHGVTFLDLDVASDASVTAAVQQVIERFGRIDVLVNNAGIGSMGAAEETSIAQAPSTRSRATPSPWTTRSVSTASGRSSSNPPTPGPDSRPTARSPTCPWRCTRRGDRPSTA
ncbi:YhgE/Pip-like protein [Streptomyces sp. V4I2]|nr:YhgE/Pip-like protein [Streptomyces sp. V4I2]